MLIVLNKENIKEYKREINEGYEWINSYDSYEIVIKLVRRYKKILEIEDFKLITKNLKIILKMQILEQNIDALYSFGCFGSKYKRIAQSVFFKVNQEIDNYVFEKELGLNN